MYSSFFLNRSVRERIDLLEEIEKNWEQSGIKGRRILQELKAAARMVLEKNRGQPALTLTGIGPVQETKQRPPKSLKAPRPRQYENSVLGDLTNSGILTNSGDFKQSKRKAGRLQSHGSENDETQQQAKRIHADIGLSTMCTQNPSLRTAPSPRTDEGSNSKNISVDKDGGNPVILADCSTENLEYPKNKINDGTMDKGSTGYQDGGDLAMSESEFRELKSLFHFDPEDVEIDNISGDHGTMSGDHGNCDTMGWPSQDNDEKALTPERQEQWRTWKYTKRLLPSGRVIWSATGWNTFIEISRGVSIITGRKLERGEGNIDRIFNNIGYCLLNCLLIERGLNFAKARDPLFQMAPTDSTGWLDFGYNTLRDQVRSLLRNSRSVRDR